jgi:hypothetical protein
VRFSLWIAGCERRTVFEATLLEVGGHVAQEAELVFGTQGQGVFPENGLQPGAALGWDVTEKVLQSGGKEVLGDEGQKLGERSLGSDEGLEGVAGAGVDGGDGALEVSGELLRVGGELPGKVVRAGGIEGMGVLAGSEGVEVAAGGASATGAEFGIAVGAAMGVAVHGPVATALYLAAGLVGISSHVPFLRPHCSTNVLFCQICDLQELPGGRIACVLGELQLGSLTGTGNVVQ